MTAEQRSLLFQPFNRLGREHSNVPGTGIGLVLVKELVELMGGKLDISSETATGTSVSVTLPCVAPMSEERIPSNQMGLE